MTVLATWACPVQDRALSVEWSCGELRLWSGAMGSGTMGSSVEWSCGELPVWSRAIGSFICGVELCGAPFVSWGYGELHPWSGTMGSSVEWSCGELHLWRGWGVMGSSICEVELCGALSVRWSYGKLCGVELWGAQSVWWSYEEVWFWRWLLVVNFFGLASLLWSHRISIWRMVSWFYGILLVMWNFLSHWSANSFSDQFQGDEEEIRHCVQPEWHCDVQTEAEIFLHEEHVCGSRHWPVHDSQPTCVGQFSVYNSEPGVTGVNVC